ncbi:MAG: DUF1697 domain-containing protein [Candidatus Sulfotelmatobacter sp.]|jgi:uncharacterized protein (DUF1697 family)
MPIYVCLLRGINVGGHKKIKMDQLRTSIEALGFEQVKTYIQSGNVVFNGAKASPASLCGKIEKIILDDFGHSVSAVIRTADEMKKVLAGNPFLKERGVDPEKLHVMFLSDAPESLALDKLAALIAPPEQFRCVGKDLYFHLPNGVGESIVMKKPINRVLAVTTTMRNWRTVSTLHQMCLDCR